MKIFTKKLLLAIMLLANLTMVAQISGTKTIGSNNADYTTINEAVDALLSDGISSDVIFNIQDGNYNEKIAINDSIIGARSYSITFQSESLDSSKVILSIADVTKEYLVELTHVNNIIFNSLSFSISGNYSSMAFKLQHGIRNFTITNCQISAPNNTPTLIYLDQPMSYDSSSYDLSISNTLFENAYSAISIKGGYYGIVNNVNVENNIFINQKAFAVSLLNTENIIANGNTIKTSVYTYDDLSAFGIGLDNCTDFEVFNNDINTTYGNGILINSCNNSSDLKKSIYNNFIIARFAELSATGLTVLNSEYVDVIYNTIRLFGLKNGWSNTAASFQDNENINVQNNIFYNDDVNAVSISGNTNILTWDYNYLYSPSQYFARYENESIASFDEWKTNTGLDAHSISAEMNFKSDSNSHLNTPIIDSLGSPWAAITVDIDGETRNTSTPDIGADEFEITNEIPQIKDQEFAMDENPDDAILIASIIATDADADQTITFSIIKGNDSNAFNLDSVSGELTVAMSEYFNYEMVSSTVLNVKVEDNGDPKQTNNANITVFINDVNEAPVFVEKTYSINENSENGALVDSVEVSDPDMNQTITYSIVAGNDDGIFSIDEITGKLFVADSTFLNAEVSNELKIEIEAKDDHSIPLSTKEEIVIEVIDINEAPFIENQTFAIDENSANGTTIGTIIANDEDNNQNIASEITKGNDTGAFELNSTTGELSVAKSEILDFETTPEFEIEITVTDDSSDKLSTSAIVTINLNDLTETSITGNDNAEVKVYPNPSKGRISIEGINDNAKIEVYTLNGTKILESNNNEIEINDFTGIVIVKVIDNNKISMHRIVIE